jgi:hypothetical protein
MIRALLAGWPGGPEAGKTRPDHSLREGDIDAVFPPLPDIRPGEGPSARRVAWHVCGGSCTTSEPRATPPWEGLRGPPGVHVWVKRRKVRGLIQLCLSAAQKLVAQDD